MTPELAALAALVLVHVGTIIAAQRALTRDVGPLGNLGPRDGVDDRLSPVTLRLRRASANFTENLGPFVIAVLVVVLTGHGSVLSAVLAWTYVAARVAYVPAYALGWTPWRSVIWSVGLLATLGLLALGVTGVQLP